MCKGAQLTGWEKRLLLDMQSRKPTVRLRPLSAIASKANLKSAER